MMSRFIIKGETPSKKNVNKFNSKTKRVYKDAHYERWHEDAMLQMNAQLMRLEAAERPQMIDYPIRITLSFIHGDMVRRDSDNQTSSIMDLLQDVRVLSDDRWQIVRQIHINNDYEKNEAKCLIEIERV
jgi:Holliday junction resolvase RusA-like endonuclease